jgi:polysaccharide export outer membrane protein
MSKGHMSEGHMSQGGGNRHRGALQRRALTRGALIALTLAVCGCNGSGLQEAPPYDPTVYRLGVQDQLRIVTYGDEQLTRDFRVNESGGVAIPLVGTIQAQGLTTTELADRIADALKSKQILRNPSISVEVTSFRPISVLGEVVKPGLLPYQPGMTMLTAVAAAGGFTYRGEQDYAYVIRQEGREQVVGKLKPQDYVKPGDTIKIYERYF